jgi:DNA-binding MarR family transcriptional regulator
VGVTRDDVPLEQIIRVAAFRSDLRDFQRHTDHVGRRWGLTPQRYQLLLAIKGAPSGEERLRVTDVANALGVSRNTATELCARAEAAGLVEREGTASDLRVVVLRLTREGERRLTGAIRENEKYRHEVHRAFDDLTKSFRRATTVTRARRAPS